MSRRQRMCNWDKCLGWTVNWLGFVCPCSLCVPQMSYDKAVKSARLFVASMPIDRTEHRGREHRCSPTCHGWIIGERQAPPVGIEITRCDDCDVFDGMEVVAIATKQILAALNATR